jgi:hypothetical protein
MSKDESSKMLRTKIAGLKIGIKKLMLENFENKETFEILQRQQKRLSEQERLLDNANISRETYLPELYAVLSIKDKGNTVKN